MGFRQVWNLGRRRFSKHIDYNDGNHYHNPEDAYSHPPQRIDKHPHSDYDAGAYDELKIVVDSL